MELALARGKKLYDKRDSLAEKAERRDTERSIKEIFKNA
jgi:SsrA-binding protein